MIRLDKKTIVFAVTSSYSLMLLGQIPEALASRGWRVHVVANLDDGRKSLDFPNVEMHHVDLRRKPSPLADIVATLTLIRLFVAIRPNIVSAGTPKASLVCLIAAWVTAVPHRVYTLWGLRSETFGAGIRTMLNAVEALMCALSTKVISVSPSLADEFVKIPGVDSEKVSVLGRGASKGVDIDFFQFSARTRNHAHSVRAKYGLTEKLPVVGFVGRITEDKGVYTLRRASEMLWETGIPHQVLLAGPNELAGESIEGFLGGFHGPVRWLGQFDDVRPVYRMLDCVCLPTFREGFPNVVIEAQSSGIPVVTTDATGARDAVRHGITGLIAAKGDEVDLSRQLARILTDHSLRERIVKDGRSEVENFFSSTIVVQNNLDFYSSL